MVRMPNSRRGPIAWRMAGVQLYRKQETDTYVIDAFADLFGAEIQINSQLRQDIRASTFAAGGAISVFGYRNTGRGRHERYRSTDVESARLVASGSACIEKITVNVSRDRAGRRAHGTRAARNLLNGLAFHTQGHQIRADLRLAGVAAHDLPHDRFPPRRYAIAHSG